MSYTMEDFKLVFDSRFLQVFSRQPLTNSQTGRGTTLWLLDDPAAAAAIQSSCCTVGGTATPAL
jgi:hypothetical protein